MSHLLKRVGRVPLPRLLAFVSAVLVAAHFQSRAHELLFEETTKDASAARGL